MRAHHIKILLRIVAIFLLMLGVGLLVATQIPFEYLKPQVDAISVDGDAERFTPAVYAKITTRTFGSGVCSLLLSFLLFWHHNKIQHQLQDCFLRFQIDAQSLWPDVVRHIQTLIKKVPTPHLILLILLILTGIVHRVLFLFQPMRHDEAFTFTNYASKPLILALSNYSFPNNHLFHTFWVHLSYMIFGNHEWAIRLPAFFAGILILPAIYIFIRKLFDAHAALIATGLTVCASSQIEYATNARGYAFISLFFILISILALYVRQTKNAAAWGLIAVFSAFGLYTVPTMLYPFAGVMLWIFLSIAFHDFSAESRLGFKSFILTILTTLTLTSIFYLPVILGSGLQSIIGNRFVQSLTLSGFFTTLPLRLEAVWQLVKREKKKRKISFPLSVIAGLFLCLLMQKVLPPERAWLYLLPLFMGLIGASISPLLYKIETARLQTFLSIFLTTLLSIATSIGSTKTLTAHYSYGPGTLKHAEQITQALQKELQPGDRLLTIATAAPLEYYFNKHGASITYLRQPISKSNRIFLIVLEGKYTLNQVLHATNIPGDFTPPQLAYIYPSAKVYALTRTARFKQ